VGNGVRAELLVDVAEAGEHERLVRSWLEGASRLVFDAALEESRSESLLLVASESLGGRTAQRKYSPANLEWALKAAVTGRTIARAIKGPDEGQVPQIWVRRDDADKDWAQLSIDFQEHYLLRNESFGDRLVSLFLETCQGIDPVFGWIGYGGDGVYTEFEACTLGHLGVIEGYPSGRRYLRGYDWVTVLPKEIVPRIGEGYPSGRRYLRGYDWVTVLPKEIVPRIGGIDGLRASESFHSVHPLTSGAVLTVATQRLAEYGLDEAFGVFKAVAKGLPPGQPRQRPLLGVPYRRSPVVMQDAAQFGAE
jgi:hypothetical protein